MTSSTAWPDRFAQLKKDIAGEYQDFEEKAIRSWSEIVQALGEAVTRIEAQGSEIVPQVNFSELHILDSETIGRIRKVGTVVIRHIVDDEDAARWKEELKAFVKKNPEVDGVPAGDKQFFQLYWTKPQVQARSHPNVLAASRWLNELYHLRESSVDQLEGVDLSVPLTYADRFRIRHPGQIWNFHPPHVDGGAIERWEEPDYRKCFADIFEGKWREHDPYDLQGRLTARSSLYGRPNQSTVFRTFQGWLSMSVTGPGEGTLQVFPDVGLSNAYLMLRPFFRPPVGSADLLLDPKNWTFDLSDPEFPGLLAIDGGYAGPRPTPELHPHMQLEKTMISIPKVYPGDAVFWHCDVVHSVESRHRGMEDSAVMYIPAVPKTPMNLSYVARQKDCFLAGERPPDFPTGRGEKGWDGVGKVEDLASMIGREAMGVHM